MCSFKNYHWLCQEIEFYYKVWQWRKPRNFLREELNLKFVTKNSIKKLNLKLGHFLVPSRRFKLKKWKIFSSFSLHVTLVAFCAKFSLRQVLSELDLTDYDTKLWIQLFLRIDDRCRLISFDTNQYFLCRILSGYNRFEWKLIALSNSWALIENKTNQFCFYNTSIKTKRIALTFF